RLWHGCLTFLDLESVVLTVAGCNRGVTVLERADRHDVDAAVVRRVVVRHQADLVVRWVEIVGSLVIQRVDVSYVACVTDDLVPVAIRRNRERSVLVGVAARNSATVAVGLTA